MKFYYVALLAISCYLATQLLVMSFVEMDYKAEANVHILKERLSVLQSTDAWFPLSYFEGIEKSQPGVLWLWDFLGFKKKDFFGLMKANEMWSEADNAKWTPIFLRWGLSNIETKVHGSVERGSVKQKVKWANFSYTKAASLDQFFTGTSRITSPTSFLIPNSEDRHAYHGFVFINVPIESPAAKKHAVSASAISVGAIDGMDSAASTVTPGPRPDAFICPVCSNSSQVSPMQMSASSSSSAAADVFVNVSAIERGQGTLADKKGAFRIMAATLSNGTFPGSHGVMASSEFLGKMGSRPSIHSTRVSVLLLGL